MTMRNIYECRLSAEEKAYAAENLNETDDERSTKIAEIREWILNSSDLCARTDDFSILRFLRACKFNIEKTKYKLRNYHQQRAFLPEWYRNRDPFLPELQELFNLGVFLPLKRVDEKGRMVVFIRTAVHDPLRHKQSDVLKAGLMILDLAIRDHEPVTLHGIVAILDLDGVTFRHVLQLPPSVIKNLVHAWQGCYPLRIQALDYVNAPMYVNVFLSVFKQFMNAKLKNRIHIYTHGMKEYCKQLPADIVPADYGGTDGTLQELIEYWKGEVEKNHEWLADDEKYRVTSTK